MEQELMYEDEMDAPKTKSKAVSVLDLPGVGATTAEKLASVGYDDLMSIAVASPSEIMDVTGMSEAVARKLIQASRESLDMGFSSGEDLLAKRRRVMKISTGVKDFDRILGGGFETGCISECFGQYGSAKTQIAHQLAVNVYAEDPTAVTVFIDTENTFRPERIIHHTRTLVWPFEQHLDVGRHGVARVETSINDARHHVVRPVVHDVLNARDADLRTREFEVVDAAER